jgi:hypothetical protein
VKNILSLPGIKLILGDHEESEILPEIPNALSAAQRRGGGEPE